MDFFRNQWNPINQPSRPRYPTTARGVPVHPVPPRNAPTAKPSPSPAPAPAPKVVSIPVHFVGSEKKRSASAVKIQKVFRGHLVRKSVGKIASIRRDVEAVERTISRRETVDLIRREPKERVRLNETLMSLLFKLDSIRGVDSGVRDFRKAVIKKAIALQERIDDIASGNDTVTAAEEDGSESDAVETGEQQSSETEANQIGGEEALEIEERAREIEGGASEVVPSSVDPEIGVESPNCEDDEPDAISYSHVSEKDCDKEEHCSADSPEPQVCEKMDISEYVVVDEKVEDEDVSDTPMDTNEEIVENPNEAVKGHLEESVDTSPTVPSMNQSTGMNNQNHNTELLEKMMEENKKMMSMMKQLFESNEMQTRMLNSLSQRVGQLEKAFVCNRLRKKKRQNGDGSGSSPDQKRFGEK